MMAAGTGLPLKRGFPVIFRLEGLLVTQGDGNKIYLIMSTLPYKLVWEREVGRLGMVLKLKEIIYLAGALIVMLGGTVFTIYKFKDFIKGVAMESSLYLFGAFTLGILHALAPGHGKTIVGAYLVGSRGRIIDAILLGTIVTITHTGGVILLGIIAVIASAYIVPERIQQIASLVSGILIVAVGGWLFI